MPRLIEIALFLAPFLAVLVWRILFPSPRPPIWLVWWMSGVLVVLAASLLWLRITDAEDPHRAYIPAELRDGQVLPPRIGPRP